MITVAIIRNPHCCVCCNRSCFYTTLTWFVFPSAPIAKIRYILIFHLGNTQFKISTILPVMIYSSGLCYIYDCLFCFSPAPSFFYTGKCSCMYPLPETAGLDLYQAEWEFYLVNSNEIDFIILL